MQYRHRHLYTALNNILETFFFTFILAVPLGNIMRRTLLMPAKQKEKKERKDKEEIRNNNKHLFSRMCTYKLWFINSKY